MPPLLVGTGCLLVAALVVVRALPGGLSTLVRTFDRPMGIAADPRRFALGTRGHVVAADWGVHLRDGSDDV